MSKVRAFASVCMVVVGFFLLTGGAGFGPCGGGSVATWKPTPGVEFIIQLVALEMMVGSYFLVKQNRSEGLFRMAVYVVLIVASLGLPLELFLPRIVRWGAEDTYWVALSAVAVVNLVFFVKHVGVANTPRNPNPLDGTPNAFTKSLLLWDAVVLGPATVLFLSRLVEVEDPLAFLFWFFALGIVCVGVVFWAILSGAGALKPIAVVSGGAIMVAGGLMMANVFGGFETSVAAWGMGLLLSIPSAIACWMIAGRQARPSTAGRCSFFAWRQIATLN